MLLNPDPALRDRRLIRSLRRQVQQTGGPMSKTCSVLWLVEAYEAVTNDTAALLALNDVYITWWEHLSS